MTHHQPPHNPRALVTREAKRAYFDKISGVYDLLSDRAEEPVRERGLELLDAKAGERVLELGCGTGHATISLAGSVGETGRVDALDLSPKMIRQAEANVHALELHDRVNFIVGDALKLDVADATYDAVFASFMIELFDSAEMSSLLAEVRRVLRAGGRFAAVGLSCEGDDSAAAKVNEWLIVTYPTFSTVDRFTSDVFLSHMASQSRSPKLNRCGFLSKSSLRHCLEVPIAYAQDIQVLTEWLRSEQVFGLLKFERVFHPSGLCWLRRAINCLAA